MQPVSCPQCSPQLAHLREHATSGIKQIMAVAESMKTDIATLPDDLKPFGQALADSCLQALAEAFFQSLKVSSELCLQEITREARTPEHQIEKE